MDHERSLGTVSRDTTFYPTINPTPKRLTHSEIARFNEQGFLRGYRVFDGAGVEENRAYFDDLLDKVSRAGEDPGYGITDYHVRCQRLYDIATDARILGYVEDLLGPDVVLWHTHVFAKPPGETRTVPWHQDAAYWPLTPTKTITVWLAIDDSDRANGALEIIPGTHREILGYDIVDREKTGNVLSRKTTDAERYGEPVCLELNAGEISLHADMMVHGSKPNRSNRRRCGLTLRYCPVDVRVFHDPERERNPDARPASDYRQKSVIVLGSDPAGYWADVPRPLGELELAPCRKPSP